MRVCHKRKINGSEHNTTTSDCDSTKNRMHFYGNVSLF